MSIPPPARPPSPPGARRPRRVRDRALGLALLAAIGGAGCSGDGGAPDPGPDAAPPVASPLAYTRISGTAAQGSRLWGELSLVDPEASLDFTVADDAFEIVDPVLIVPDGFTGFLADESGLSGLSAKGDGQGKRPAPISVYLDVDVGAPAGWLPIELRYADGRTLTLPRAIEIAAREPIELTAGATVSGELAGDERLNGESQLYRLALEADSIVGVTASTLELGDLLLLGPSGSFRDVRSARPDSGTMADEQIYLVALGFRRDDEPVQFELSTRVAPLGDATATDLEAPHEGAEAAQPLAFPVTVSGATLEYVPATGYFDDWYAIEIDPGHAGRTLAASLTAEDDADGVVVDLALHAADGTILATTSSDEYDVSYRRRTLFSPPLAAGTYYLEARADVFTAATVPYSLGVALVEVQP